MNSTYDISHLIKLLGTVRHFQPLPPDDLEAIVRAGQIHRYDQGDLIFLEGAPCTGLFVLLRGQVHLCKLGPDGREQIMSIIEPVIMFNEVPALDGGSNVATARANVASTVWRTSCDAFQALLPQYPQIALGLLKVLARRNRFLISQYEDLSFRTVVDRTAKLLLTLSEDGKVAIDRYANPNTELAARIATVPEAFSRALGLLRGNGYIRCTRSAIHVLKPEFLAEMAAL
ncbi:MAG: Crp/Fnr family transcriptional regulator [Anaerolineae bacterium]